MILSNYWTADFETTTDENDCRVWAFSICNIEDPSIFVYGTSIEEFFDWLENNNHAKLWFHNLKFDLQFILSYLFTHGFSWVEDKKYAKDKTFTTLITDMGQFYSCKIFFKVAGRNTQKVTLYDSLKIFPNFSVARVAEGFNLPIRKLEIDYKKYREKGYQLTSTEVDYIRNDVEIMARALKIMFNQGLNKMTIAGDAMNDYRNRCKDFRAKFPIINSLVDKDIRKAYRGGFTYANETSRGKTVGGGVVLDVNSLYPSTLVEHYMPYGEPVWFDDKWPESSVYPLYIQHLSCQFEIKPGRIPCIQLKHNLSFAPTEYVKSSHGEVVELTLTSVDLKLFLEQYQVKNLTWQGGWMFKQARGFFDNYITYWTERKIQAAKEGNAPIRQISKLMLNSLYGRFALNGTAASKAPYLGEDGVVHYIKQEDEERETVYLPVGCFVTAYGRDKTIRTSQAIADYTRKKYGEDRYYYSDTDSIHAALSQQDLEELGPIIHIDEYKLGYWSKEAEFTKARYLHAKCYIEEIDGKVFATVAGLPKYLSPLINFDNFKTGFTTADMSIEQMRKLAKSNGASKEEIEKLHHKLTYKYVKGGVILDDTDFTIK